MKMHQSKGIITILLVVFSTKIRLYMVEVSNTFISIFSYESPFTVVLNPTATDKGNTPGRPLSITNIITNLDLLISID